MASIGIIDIQLYFPRYYVSLEELEEFEKENKGKYLLGLGQKNMAFNDDVEDINSMFLSVLYMLLTKNNISLDEIGRLEVGTETMIDKSKSSKTVLMDLLYPNTDIEGVTVTNACYSGTQALFNCFDWANSRYNNINNNDKYTNNSILKLRETINKNSKNTNKKYAILITGDIACYSSGPARPTGGCGVLGILIGKGGSAVLDDIRATFMKNVYDFYKPNPLSEYPVVDGHFSLNCYLEALYECIKTYKKKGGTIDIEKDYICFHCPYSKLVEKAFFQLISVTIMDGGKINDNIGNNYHLDRGVFDELKSKDFKFWLISKENQNKIKNKYINLFKEKIEPGLFFCKELGNMYSGSVFGFLYSIFIREKYNELYRKIFKNSNDYKINKDNGMNNGLSDKDNGTYGDMKDEIFKKYSLLYDKSYDNIYNTSNMVGKKVIMFSYGSGLASSIYSFNIVNLNYKQISNGCEEILNRLNNRIKISPYKYESIMLKKEKLYLRNNYNTSGKVSDLFPCTFYLTKVDDKWRRFYKQKDNDCKENNISNLIGKTNLIFNGNGSVCVNNICGNRDNNINNYNDKNNELITKKNNDIDKNIIKNNNGNFIYINNNDNIDSEIWDNFYKKSILERQAQIKKMFPNIDMDCLNKGGLTLLRASNLTENCIGILSLPVGIVPLLMVNGRKYSVPIVTEEPSVVAAASSAAKFISKFGGFTAYKVNNNEIDNKVNDSNCENGNIKKSDNESMVIGDIYYENLGYDNDDFNKKFNENNANNVNDVNKKSKGNILDNKINVQNLQKEKQNINGIGSFELERKKKHIENICKIVYENKSKIIEYCNTRLCSGMYKRGGGICDIYVREIGNSYSFYAVEFIVNCCDAMGANIVNTISEGLAEFFKSTFHFPDFPLLRILSNLPKFRIFHSHFLIPVKCLSYKSISGQELAQRIVKANSLAVSDILRAVTHLKGVMNGISGAALALGQDVRGVEAGVWGEWARRRTESGGYKPLTNYEIVDINGEKYLKGSIEIGLNLGTVGGAINSHPAFLNNLLLLSDSTPSNSSTSTNSKVNESSVSTNNNSKNISSEQTNNSQNNKSISQENNSSNKTPNNSTNSTQNEISKNSKNNNSKDNSNNSKNKTSSASSTSRLSSMTLSMVISSLGLAQNFAALRALVAEGIQSGHLRLHAKNIAYRAGAPDYIVNDVAKFIMNTGDYSEECAKKYVESLKLYGEIRGQGGLTSRTKPVSSFSTFYIDLGFDFLKKPIKMNFLINSQILPPIHIILSDKISQYFGNNSKSKDIKSMDIIDEKTEKKSDKNGTIEKNINDNKELKMNKEKSDDNYMKNDPRLKKIYQDLFGKEKKPDWAYEFIIFLHQFDLFPNTLEEVNIIKYKVFLCIIIMFTITEQMLKINFDVVSKFIEEMINQKGKPSFTLLEKLNNEEITKNISIQFGLTVINELYLISNFYISNYIVTHKFLISVLKSEINLSIMNFILIKRKYINTLNYRNKGINNGYLNKNILTPENFNEFFDMRITRLNAVILILILIGFSNRKLNEFDIDRLIALGKFARIFITLNRDYYKKSTKSENSYNAFKEFYFNNIKNKDKHSITEKELKTYYFEFKNKEIEELTKEINEINIENMNINGQLLLNKVKNKIENYYKIYNYQKFSI